MHYPYQAFLQGTGLTVKPFRIHWHTTALNRTVVKWASKYPRPLSLSFDLGVWVSIVLLPIICIAHFAWTFFLQSDNGNAAAGSTTGTAASASSAATVGLELMLPGINLPLDEIGYYIAALAVCTVLHEIGHAAAAVLVDVPVSAFGVHLFVVFPMAYTELNTDRLHALRLWPKLRVLCAGIWHNVLLAAAAWATFAALSVLLQPWFATGSGVIVTHMDSRSPLRGERGFVVGDVLTDVNGCTVTDRDTWYACLLLAIRQPPAYCMRSEHILIHDESVPAVFRTGGAAADGQHLVECCDPNSPKNVCFEYAPADEEDNVLAEIPQHMCLNARTAIEAALGYCRGGGAADAECVDSFCVRPLLGNGTTVMQVRRREGTAADVMYVGHPADISKTVRVSEFVPKTRWLGAAWADGVARLLRYVVVFSMGLAFVNVLPCYAFDGQHIVAALVQHGLVRWVPERGRRELIAFGVTGAGSLLFAAGLVKVAYATWSRYWY